MELSHILPARHFWGKKYLQRSHFYYTAVGHIIETNKLNYQINTAYGWCNVAWCTVLCRSYRWSCLLYKPHKRQAPPWSPAHGHSPLSECKEKTSTPLNANIKRNFKILVINENSLNLPSIISFCTDRSAFFFYFSFTAFEANEKQHNKGVYWCSPVLQLFSRFIAVLQRSDTWNHLEKHPGQTSHTSKSSASPLSTRTSHSPSMQTLLLSWEHRVPSLTLLAKAKKKS